MSTPQTLFALAGLSPAPAAVSEATILLIDMQREYRDGLLPLPGVGPATEAGGRLLARARRAGAPVVHILHRGGAGGPFDPAGPGVAPLEAVAPAAGEVVLEKTLPNAFAGTALAEVLADLGPRPLIVAGFMTHMCVSSTVRAALDHGLSVTVLAEATATRALPDPAGGAAVPAEVLQAASLAALGDRFAAILPRLPAAAINTA